MEWINSHTQQPQMPKIDLTKLKSMSEEDWKEIVNHIPFQGNPSGDFRDYTDGSNRGMTNHVFKTRVFQTAKESGMSMLRTLNFNS